MFFVPLSLSESNNSNGRRRFHWRGIMGLLSPAMTIVLLISLLVIGSHSQEHALKKFGSQLDLDVAESEPKTVETANNKEYSESSPEVEFSSFFHDDFEDDPVFSTLFADPVQNDALLSPELKNSDKREEYYDNLAKKAENAFPILKAFKSKPESAEDLQAGASASDYFVPPSSSDYRRPSGYSSYEEYFPKRQGHGGRDYSSSPSFPISSYEVEYPAVPHKSYPNTRYHNSDPIETYPKPHVSSPKKYYPRSRSATPTTTDNSKYSRSRNYPKHSPSSSSLNSKPITYRPVTASPKKRKYRKSPETVARHSYSNRDLPSKPPVKSFKTTQRSIAPTLESEEGRLFLAATDYGKPVREQFHEQGTTGPHSYKFGYNTGDKDNPMARYEERSPEGIVKGSYSFVNPLGELKVVRYESHPIFGFRTSA